MLTTMTELLTAARSEKRAVGAFNVGNYETLLAVFRGAEATGLPVNAFLQKLRVEEACRLLLCTDMTIAEISTACGFGDVKAFYGAFKRILHTTPGKYRTQK